MKKLKYFTMILIMCMSTLMIVACGKVKVNYDLASSGSTMTYSTVINMQSSPKKYVGKTFRIRGKVDTSGSTLYLYGYDSSSCCTWELKIGTDNTDVDLSKKTGYVTVLGTYEKDSSGYYLDIIGLG